MNTDTDTRNIYYTLVDPETHTVIFSQVWGDMKLPDGAHACAYPYDFDSSLESAKALVDALTTDANVWRLIDDAIPF